MISLQVKPHLLYKPNLNDINVVPDQSATFELFDRVVIVRDQYSVPLGTRGTIISILPRTDPNPIRQENIHAVDYIYEILFDKPFELGTSIPDVAENRIFKVRKSVLMNITHGAGRPIKEQSKMNGNGPRQKNGTVNETPPPNAWRVIDKKPILRNENIERKPVEQKSNPILVNNVKSNLNQVSDGSGELINLAHKVNIAERLKKQKENETIVATEDDILKKLLGVDPNKLAQATTSQSILSPKSFPSMNNTQKIDLNSLFGKTNLNDLGSNLPNPSSLPKPPTEWQWRQKSTDKEPIFLPHPSSSQQQQQQQQLPLQSLFPNNQPNQPLSVMNQQMHYPPQYFPQQYPNMAPPPPPMNMMPFQQPMMPPHMYRPPMYIPSQNYPMPMIHPRHPAHHMLPGPQPFMQAPHQIRMSTPAPHFDGLHNSPIPVMHSSPEGPQKLKTKSGTASAFIPLQAARKNTKLKANVHKKGSNEITTKDANSDKPLEDDSKQMEVYFGKLSSQQKNYFYLFFFLLFFSRKKTHNRILKLRL